MRKSCKLALLSKRLDFVVVVVSLVGNSSNSSSSWMLPCFDCRRRAHQVVVGSAAVATWVLTHRRYGRRAEGRGGEQGRCVARMAPALLSNKDASEARSSFVRQSGGPCLPFSLLLYAIGFKATFNEPYECTGRHANDLTIEKNEFWWGGRRVKAGETKFQTHEQQLNGRYGNL